jgi:hypothetical protein
MSFARSCVPVLAGSLLFASASVGQTVVQSTVSTPAMSAAMANFISIAVNAGATQTIANVADSVVNAFPAPVTITLTWDLHPSTANVQVIGYFANPAMAMSSGSVGIPSSWIKGRVLTADVVGAPTTFTPFTQNAVGGVGTTGGSLALMTQPVLGFSKTGSKTINLELQLDLVGRVLTAGTYMGTLNIRAVTQ